MEEVKQEIFVLKEMSKDARTALLERVNSIEFTKFHDEMEEQGEYDKDPNIDYCKNQRENEQKEEKEKVDAIKNRITLLEENIPLIETLQQKLTKVESDISLILQILQTQTQS